MILSPYHNPPYRKPNAQSSSTPPRSPKRKRGDDGSKAPLQTSPVRQAQDEEPLETGSPRMQVTSKLNDLRLESDGPQTSPSTKKPRTLQRKRPKQVEAGGDGDLPVSTKVSKVSPKPKGDQQQAWVVIGEVAETPNATMRPHVSPASATGSPEDGIAASETRERPSKELEDGGDAAKLRLTTLSDKDATATLTADPTPRSVSPLPVKEDLTDEQKALTWQEDEITGFEIDAASGDDGLGINGIGFMPTAAIAQARKQKRRQQVNDWKVREGREARQKRMDRRRGELPHAVPNPHETEEQSSKPMVRFAGIA